MNESRISDDVMRMLIQYSKKKDEHLKQIILNMIQEEQEQIEKDLEIFEINEVENIKSQ